MAATDTASVGSARRLAELAGVVERHCGAWPQPTPIPRLELVSSGQPVGPFHVMYSPMICFVVSGGKETIAGSRRETYEAGSYLLSSLELPVTFSITRAPYRAAVLHLDAATIADLLLELDEAGPPATAVPDVAALAVASMSDPLLDALGRLVGLLDAPDDLPVLAPRYEAEVLLRLLRGPSGPAIRQLALADSRLTHIRAAARWIRDHMDEPLSVHELADVATMSAASLHRHFRAATGMTPGQFQKRLRLQTARSALLAGESNAASVASTVGYGSVTQFTREYAREFGVPPAADARRLRAAAGLT